MAQNLFLLRVFSILTSLFSCTVARLSIIRGDIAGIDEFPYMVALRVNGVEECGGSIIEKQFILTAAHCVFKDNGQFDSRAISILAGTNDRNQKNKPAVIVDVQKIYVPLEYNPPPIHTSADIAVLKLRNLLEFSKHIKKLELPKHEHETYADKKAMFTGFGWDWIKIGPISKEGGSTDTYLRFAEANVLSPKQCSHDYGIEEEMPIKLLCARIKQREDTLPRGICLGDSGGALVHDHTVIGVLSHGPFGCTEKKFPAVYTRVTKYLTFIHNAIKDHHSHDIRTHEIKY